MAFGNYTPGAANVDQTSTIVVRCSNGTPYGIGLDPQGTGSTPSFARTCDDERHHTARWITPCSPTPARTDIWVNPATAAAAAGNQGGIGTGLGNALTHTVYGRLLDRAISQAAAPAADYTSTVTATITY